MESKEYRTNKEDEFVKQFDNSFNTKLKDKINNPPLLIDLFHNYIGQEFKKSDLYDEIINKIISIEDDLVGTLNTKQKELFEKWENCRDELENYTAEQSFIYGYCFNKELNIENNKYGDYKSNNNLMDIIYLVNQKYSDDVSLILDNDLLIIQYMYIIGEDRDVYKSLEVKKFEDKFYIRFINEKIEKIITLNELEDIFKIYKRQTSKRELTQIEINSLKEKYVKGTRIELLKMYDIQEVPPKTKGIVDFVDDIGQIHIQWENGSTLALNVGVDEFKII